jgi:hypothetical protein
LPATEKIVAEAVAVHAARARSVIGMAFILNMRKQVEVYLSF